MSTPEPMSDPLAGRIYESAHLVGEFRLRSGVTADEYFDKYRFESDPVLLGEIVERLRGLLPDDVEALAGLELGGVPIATALSLRCGVPARFIRREPKTYGTCRLAEGGEIAGRRLVIVEDVVTSAGQIIESCHRLRELGAQITTAICVIDRGAGGAANLAAESVELRSLFTIDDLKAAATND